MDIVVAPVPPVKPGEGPALSIAAKRPELTTAFICLDRGDDDYVRPIMEAIADGTPIPISGPVTLYRFADGRWEILAFAVR